MAKQVITVLTDDLDGGDSDGTVEFGLDGVNYGPTSYEFASGKPIELIDGANLLYLLAEHAQLQARIDATEFD